MKKKSDVRLNEIFTEHTIIPVKRNIDVFHLSETLYRKNNKVWKRVEKNGRIPLEEDTIKSITIHVKLQNTGRNNSDPLFEEEDNKGLEERYQIKAGTKFAPLT